MIIGVTEVVAGVREADVAVGAGVTEAERTCISALRHASEVKPIVNKLIAIRKYRNSRVFIGLRTATARMVNSGICDFSGRFLAARVTSCYSNIARHAASSCWCLLG